MIAPNGASETRDEGEAPRSSKRRGLMAGAAALVVATLVRQTTDSVSAANGDALKIGGDAAGSGAEQVGGAMTWLGTFPIAANPAFRASNGVGTGFDAKADGAQGFADGAGNSGIFGRNNALNGVGTWGEAPSGTGIFGDSGSGSGVAGNSSSGAGLYGQSTGGTGVTALIPSSSAASNTIAVNGSNQSTGGSGFGIYGFCQNGNGLVGATGSAPNAAFVGSTNGVAGAYAAIFYGPVAITGPKSAAVKNADGSHTLLYCVEAPESWFEDFGTGTLVNGKGIVKLDPDFTRLIHGDYHVFITEHGGHHGLHTTSKDAGSFTVAADADLTALKQKQPSDLSGTFSFRIVGKRSDIDSKRLAKVQLPPEPDHKEIQAQLASQRKMNPLPTRRP